MTAGSHALWAFRKIAARLFGGDDGATAQWAMLYVLEHMTEADLKRRGIDLAAFERERGLASISEHTSGPKRVPGPARRRRPADSGASNGGNGG
jgi:hypothetical protein